jgi:general secretion pathway protein A
MYEPFFGLENAPFGLTPDPRFLFRSKGHHDILATLLYGVTSGKGIMLLIGDVGTGKTTLCRALLRDLPAEVESVLILNPHLSDAELIGAILDDLGLPRQGTTKGELMTVLGQHLLAVGAEGKTVVLVVDEAQQMSVEALEQIRILSTLEAPGRKLLQIVLAGQTELDAKLARPQLRQLNQRVGVRTRLGPLGPAETVRYVEHRLRTAGLGGSLPFTRGAIARVHRHSRGVPRVINLVCDRALAAAFADRSRQVGADTVDIAIRNLQGRPARSRRAVPIAVAIIVLVLAAAGVIGGQMWWRARQAAARMPSAVAALVPPAQEASATPPPSATLPPTRDAAPGPAPVPASPPVVAPAVAPVESRRVLAELIGLWSGRPVPAAVIAGWPAAADGALDIPGIAARYELATTRLAPTTAEELRAIGLPALLSLADTGGQLFLLRRVSGDTATLVDGTGTETQQPLAQLTTRLSGGDAVVLWRNLDALPTDPRQQMTPAVAMTVGLRLHRLGLVTTPVPQGPGPRLEQGVRAFQRSVGLPQDGIVGPRTTLALSRIVAGTLAPGLVSVASR